MSFGKEDKWLLASHLQKAIRRGWVDEAVWAAFHLYNVDRAYFAYRLSVIAVEDVGAGSPEIAKWVDLEKPWGAKRFGFAKKSEEDWAFWLPVVTDFASSIKDRTPCEWMACTRWLNEFENKHGSWLSQKPDNALEQAYNTNLQWWERGLFAWRAAGTKRFPSDHLPADEEGVWDDFVRSSPTQDVQTILLGFGARQREAHPVFLPLAVSDRSRDPTAHAVMCQVGDIVKHGHWISPALDKHTGEGKRALFNFINSKPHERDQLYKHLGQEQSINAVGALMFWMEGGVVNHTQLYATAQTIASDIKKRFLKSNQLNGRWLFETWGDKKMWEHHRERVINPQNSLKY